MYNFHTCNSELLLAEINEEISNIDKVLRFKHDQDLVDEQQELFEAREWAETYMAPPGKVAPEMVEFDEKKYQIWKVLRSR
jgi:hypothetical protein